MIGAVCTPNLLGWEGVRATGSPGPSPAPLGFVTSGSEGGRPPSSLPIASHPPPASKVPLSDWNVALGFRPPLLISDTKQK